MTVAAPPRREMTSGARYRHSLWLLTKRDLKVRYSTSALGYLWSILDPLLMSAIYYFVFVIVFDRSAVDKPYIVFLLTGLLPWVWFSGAVGDMTRAFIRDAKLIRSTSIPRSIWVMRIVFSKGIEFLASIPVLIIFALASLGTSTPAHLQWGSFYSLLAIAIQAVLITGIGLIIAPVVVFFRDLERAVKLILRLMFYVTPIVYGLEKFDTHNSLKALISFNPMTGIMALYRASFFAGELDWFAVLMSAVISLIVLAVGMLTFRRNVRAVLKEI